MLESILGLAILGLDIYLEGKDNNGKFSCETLSNNLEKECKNKVRKMSDEQLIFRYKNADNSKEREIFREEMRRRHLM
ncbi:MAG: hypothetical protein IJF03_03040 [Lachnospiraceae bacterium]|nr:hypothetical protein [Lachnospiraceae bacterium]